MAAASSLQASDIDKVEKKATNRPYSVLWPFFVTGSTNRFALSVALMGRAT